MPETTSPLKGNKGPQMPSYFFLQQQTGADAAQDVPDSSQLDGATAAA